MIYLPPLGTGRADPNTYTKTSLWCFGLHTHRPYGGSGHLRSWWVHVASKGMRRKTDVDGYIREMSQLKEPKRGAWPLSRFRYTMAHNSDINLPAPANLSDSNLAGASVGRRPTAVQLFGTRPLDKGTPPSVLFSVWDATGATLPKRACAVPTPVVNLAGRPVGTNAGPRRLRRESAQPGWKATTRPGPHPGHAWRSGRRCWCRPRRVGFTRPAARGAHRGARSPAGAPVQVCGGWGEHRRPGGAVGRAVVKLRLGVVRENGGGRAGNGCCPLSWGLVGTLGTGRQWMSWIHHRRTPAGSDIVRGGNHCCHWQS